ncbi:MAG: hypothetical protein CMF70_03035 [Magnetovibrio sp.]|nr:hypothetical protein [Magnetovibrio sp.]
MTLFTPPIISEKILVLDGIARTGKMLVGPLAGELENVEWPQNLLTVDNIPSMGHILKSPKKETAAFLRLIVNASIYEFVVGRHLNTRVSDIYSIHRSLKWQELDGRRFGPEHDNALQPWLAKKRYASFISHHQFPFWPIWLEAFPTARFLITTRHPVDTCASWMKKGWGERFGSDPLDFTQTADFDGFAVPWFAETFSSKYIKAEPIDRTIFCVLSLMELYDKTLQALPSEKKEMVHTVCFEEAANRPDYIFSKIASWLKTSLPSEWPVAKARERVPRILSINERREKLDAISKTATKEYVADLFEASKRYEIKWDLESL